MDILISSNLERLLYTVAGAEKTAAYMRALGTDGKYTVDADVKAKIDESFLGYFCDEELTKKTIRDTFDTDHYLCDTHTAVGLAASPSTAARARSCLPRRQAPISLQTTFTPRSRIRSPLTSLRHCPHSRLTRTQRSPRRSPGSIGVPCALPRRSTSAICRQMFCHLQNNQQHIRR